MKLHDENYITILTHTSVAMADLIGAGLGHYFTDIETAEQNSHYTILNRAPSRSPSQDPSLLPGQEDDFIQPYMPLNAQ